MSHHYEVVRSQQVWQGRVTGLRSDEVRMPGGATSSRDVVVLPGAVAIVPYREDGQVLLVRQYRHPVARMLWELPAGLLDSTTESAQEAGERELFEEGQLRAGRWDTLVDVLTSPGMTDETIRVLLARDLTPVPEDEQFDAFHEEAEMERTWVSLDAAVARVLSGDVENGITAAGLLAAHVSRARDWTGLRPVGAQWRARKG